jgi:hypothetical protein
MMDDEQLLPACEHIARLAQAMGMVAADVECSFDDAFILIDACAQVSGQSIDEVAGAVIARAEPEQRLGA